MRRILPAGAVRLFCNALRVMGGSGRPSCVLGDLSDAASEMQLEPDADASLENGLQSWRDASADFQSQRYFEDAICAASLRMVAARSQDNVAECARAQGELWGAVLQWRQKMADEHGLLHSSVAAPGSSRASDTKVVRAVSADIPTDAKSFVYFISDGAGHIKIGKAVSPRRRMADLQTSSALPLRLVATMPGGYYVEKRLHQKFKEHRVSGEWFTDCAEIQAYIGEPANDNSVQIKSA